jgi:hypothetical protein
MVHWNPSGPHLWARTKRSQHPHSLHSLHCRSRLRSIGIRDGFRHIDSGPGEARKVLGEGGREGCGLRRSGSGRVVGGNTNGNATPLRRDRRRPSQRRRRWNRREMRKVWLLLLLLLLLLWRWWCWRSGERGGRPGWWCLWLWL